MFAMAYKPSHHTQNKINMPKRPHIAIDDGNTQPSQKARSAGFVDMCLTTDTGIKYCVPCKLNARVESEGLKYPKLFQQLQTRPTSNQPNPLNANDLEALQAFVTKFNGADTRMDSLYKTFVQNPEQSVNISAWGFKPIHTDNALGPIRIIPLYDEKVCKYFHGLIKDYKNTSTVQDRDSSVPNYGIQKLQRINWRIEHLFIKQEVDYGFFSKTVTNVRPIGYQVVQQCNNSENYIMVQILQNGDIDYFIKYSDEDQWHHMHIMATPDSE